MDPIDCNCAALRQASRFVSRFYDEALAPAGLGINQYSILARLRRCEFSTIQDLARMLVMDRSTLGHLLRPLEQRGLVRLSQKAEDGRCRQVCLTPQGEARLEAARPLWQAAQHSFETAFGPDDARALREALAAVTALSPTIPETTQAQP